MRNLSNYRVMIFLTIAVCQLVFGCNLTYKVRNQNHDIEEILYLPVGKITVELVGKGNSKFIFRQKFDLLDNAIVYVDSLKIICNDVQIAAEHNLNSSRKVKGGVEIEKGQSWEASFEFESGVFEGDTILIAGPGYVQCRDQVISLDTMIYSFTNNLRIYGVNDF